MDILVIGGSKFSGKYTVEILAERGHDVTVLNRGESAKETGVADYIKPMKFSYPEKVKTIQVDRTDNEKFSELLAGNSYEAIIDTCAYNDKHIQGVLDIASNDLEHYVFISTASVYDDDKMDMFPLSVNAPIGSEADDFPEAYTRNKRRAETVLKRAMKENNFPGTIIRPTYIYGPHNPLYREFYFFDRLLDQKPIYMPGNGEFITDFVFCKDLAWLTTAPLENKKAVGEIYNATGEGGSTLNKYVDFHFEVSNKKTELIHFDPEIPKQAELKPESFMQMFPFMYDAHLILSRENAVLDLVYQPTPFLEGLKETYEWYLKVRNPEWKADYTFDEKLAKLLKK
ncbi:MAG: NAD-dependent epimerase/dehydratase family protein [Candidatus Heimdallarchaeota archaeon]